MRILTATLITETNTFSPMATGLSAFSEMGLFHGRHEPIGDVSFTQAMRLWETLAVEDGHELVASLAAFAAPAGPTVRAVYETFRDEILDDAASAPPLDAVLLHLHGAMVAEGYDDCEGDLLARLRAIVGPDVKIGVELDPHCHLTDQMLATADVIVIYKEYPHTDTVDRARDLYRLTLDAAAGTTKPRLGAADIPIVNLWSTVSQPMRGFVDRMMAREGKGGVLSLSLAHGFPWGDVPPGCARALAVVDDDSDKAEDIAADMAREIWEMRRETAFEALSIDAAFDAVARAPEGLVVIADTADNTGGGAPGDSTFVLRRALERGMRDIAIGPLWDPIAVRFCADAGVGAVITLRLGGKCGPASGDPVDLKVIVRGYSAEHVQQAPYGGGTRVPMGPSAWVEADGIHVVLCSMRLQGLDPSLFTGLGVPLSRLRIVVPKSTNHFRAGFDPIAAATFYLVGPGAISVDFENFHYVNRTERFWPRLPDLAMTNAEPAGSRPS